MGDDQDIQMTPAICTQCGGSRMVDPNQDVTICEFCNTPFVISQAIEKYNIQQATVQQGDSIPIAKASPIQTFSDVADKRIHRSEQPEEKKKIEKSKERFKKWFPVFVLILWALFAIHVSIESGKYYEGKITIGVYSSELVGENYEKVISTLEAAGFTNIETEVIDDLMIGSSTEDGAVEKVVIDGGDKFFARSVYEPDVRIIVSYHTFPGSETSIDTSAETTVTIE